MLVELLIEQTEAFTDERDATKAALTADATNQILAFDAVVAFLAVAQLIAAITIDALVAEFTIKYEEAIGDIATPLNIGAVEAPVVFRSGEDVMAAVVTRDKISIRRVLIPETLQQRRTGNHCPELGELLKERSAQVILTPEVAPVPIVGKPPLRFIDRKRGVRGVDRDDRAPGFIAPSAIEHPFVSK